MATPLQLLQNAQQQSAQAYAQVDSVLTRTLNINAQAQAQEVDLRLKGLQFAEETRMNDARITEMNNLNEIRAREHESNMALAPLRMETERLRLQAAQSDFALKKQQQDVNLFGAITSPYDQTMGSYFMNNPNPEFMRSYIDYKGRWLGRIAQGQSFNPEEFESGINDISDNFKEAASTPPDQWSGEVSHMMGIIDPSGRLQKQYDARNPVNVENVNSLARSLITAPDNQAPSISDKLARFAPPEKFAQATIYRDIYRSNEATMKQDYQNISSLRSAISSLPEVTAQDRQRKLNMGKQLEQQEQIYRQKQQTNLRILSNITNGNFNPIQEEEPSTPQEETFSIRGHLDQVETVMGISQSGSDLLETRARAQSLVSILSDGSESVGDLTSNTELMNIDLSWWQENSTGDLPDRGSLNRIKQRVRDGIDSIGIEGRFTKTRADSLLEQVREPVRVPINPVVSELIRKHSDRYTDIFSSSGGVYDLSSIKIGGVADFESKGVSAVTARALGNADGIASFEAINRIVSKMPTKATKEEVRKELYAALITAATGNIVSR